MLHAIRWNNTGESLNPCDSSDKQRVESEKRGPEPFIDSEQTKSPKNTKRLLSRLCPLGDSATSRLACSPILQRGDVADRRGPPWNGGSGLVFPAT